MKSTITRTGDLLNRHIPHIVTMVILFLILTIPAQAQYFTKITEGTLTDVLKKTYSASWGDYNNDGWDDMVITDNNENNKTSLFKNNGDGTFSADTLNSIFTTTGPSIACVWGDYNNDGNVDLYICNIGTSPDTTAKNFLFRNDGAGVFTRITEGDIVNDMDWSLGAAWADYDNDGFIDLYVANFQTPNCLYHNNAGRSFTKITEGEAVTDNFNTYSASWSDYDNDGYQDLFVVNYFYSSLPGQNDCLYHNNGDGTFTKNTTALIANDNALTQSSSWGDFNNDGNIDLFVSSNDYDVIKHNYLYKNEGNGNFRLMNATPSTDASTSFGSSWLDVNNDGFLDLYVSNNGSTSKRKNFLYLNNGDESFTNQLADASTNDVLRDYCPTIADYDHNGYPDIFTPSYSYTLKHGLYKNNGGTNNWITLRLVGMVSNKSGIGARITCYANGMAQTREVSSTSGQYCGSTFAQTIGTGTSTLIDSIIVKWPSGIHQKLVNPTINQFLTVTEPYNLTMLKAFSLPQQTGPATIDSINNTVTCEVATGTDLTALSPDITASVGAITSPASLEVVDFSNGPVVYTVTAQDMNTVRLWTVTVTTPLSIETDILTFNVPNLAATPIIDNINHTVSAIVTDGSDLTVIVPQVTVSAGAAINPLSGTSVNFTNGPVDFTVTAENTTDFQVWSIMVSTNVGLGESKGAGNLNIFPNPTNGLIHINGISPEAFKMEIINALGQVIYSKKYANAATSEIEYSFPDASKGIYTLRLTSANHTKSIRIAVK